MGDVDRSDPAHGVVTVTVMARLASHWAVLAAAAAVILAVDISAGGNGLRAAGGIAAVLIVAAAFAPARPETDTQSANEPAPAGVSSLRAVDLAAAVPDPLFIFDRGGAILHANEAAKAAFGDTPAGLSLQLKFRAPEMQKLVRGFLAGKPEPVAIDFTERVPSERVYRVSAMPVGGTADLFVLFFEDQSENRRIDRMRADFIANASHELRTPLASVAGFIETLRGPARDDPAARDHFMQIMQDQTERMARLIDDLLSLSRLEMKPHLKPDGRVDIGAIVDGVIDTMSHRASESGIVIERRLPERPVYVAGNRDELVQVFENLLENACKYGGDGDRVIVSLEDDAEAKGEIRVAVTDFGPGIPQEHIPRITERFYRVDVATSRAQKGTGLGLSIVKHILSRHDARLTISSQIGKGSTFTVHFPA